METNRRLTIMFRWSIITSGLIAMFWGVWHLVTGGVPTLTEIKMTEDYMWKLPFEISRWWDVLFGPLIISLVIFILTKAYKTKDGDLKKGLFAGLFVGLFVGLVVGLVVGLFAGLVYGLVYGLVVGLAFGLVAGLVVGIEKLLQPSVLPALKNWLLAK